MTRLAVQSSNLKSVGYDVKTAILEVEFVNLSVYQYERVPSTVWAEFRRRMGSGESIGKYFNAHVRSSYTFTKIG